MPVVCAPHNGERFLWVARPYSPPEKALRGSWSNLTSWRGLAATKPDVLGAMERILAEEIERLTLRLAGVADVATGCIGFPQRFGSSLNFPVEVAVPVHEGRRVGVEVPEDLGDEIGVADQPLSSSSTP